MITSNEAHGIADCEAIEKGMVGEAVGGVEVGRGGKATDGRPLIILRDNTRDFRFARFSFRPQRNRSQRNRSQRNRSQ